MPGPVSCSELPPPQKTIPGGIVLPAPTTHDEMFWALPTVNAAAAGVPETAESEPDGLATTDPLAPARVWIRPSDAAAATADRSTAPAGEARTVSPAIAATRRTGARWSSATSTATGKFARARTRWSPDGDFMQQEE